MSTIRICYEDFERFKADVQSIASWPAQFSWNKDKAWPKGNQGWSHPVLTEIFNHLRDTYYTEHRTTPMFLANDHQIRKVGYDKAVMAVFELETCTGKPAGGLPC
ncbi:MAG: hypothetical protein F4045_03105 [Chloroflexi bacterium]|nr:hypothetical protein [Chloroflexota bacterium]MYK34111.1 hypothetical protein [Chloroflexota bacterium]